MKIEAIKEIKGKLLLKSGLHIGTGDSQMHIGGTDNPVVKHPHTGEPYIPGSSIKGKVRALLELKSGLMGKTNGSPLGINHLKQLVGDEQDVALKIIQLFGSSGDSSGEGHPMLGPSRASFSDCPLSDESRSEISERMYPMTEVKSENTINRIRGTAEHPRQVERVPAGLRFNFSITLKCFENDDLFDLLLTGLKLLEMDALGGSGSRGYGRVQFEFSDKDIAQNFQAVSLF